MDACVDSQVSLATSGRVFQTPPPPPAHLEVQVPRVLSCLCSTRRQSGGLRASAAALRPPRRQLVSTLAGRGGPT